MSTVSDTIVTTLKMLISCAVVKPWPLLREETMPAIRCAGQPTVSRVHESCSQTNDHGLWFGNETTCTCVQHSKMVSYAMDSSRLVLSTLTRVNLKLSSKLRISLMSSSLPSVVTSEDVNTFFAATVAAHAHSRIA